MNKFMLLFVLVPEILFAQLFLNEISSVGGYEDSEGQDCDWIEVINIGSYTVNLSSFFLSDKLNNRTKWNFPNDTLESMQQILILCSGKDRRYRDSTTFYHANFKISNNETIILSDSMGNILDQKSSSTDRSLISEGRSPNGFGSWCYFNNPSPGISNNINWCYTDITEEPSVSLSSGWYVNAEHLTITVPNNSNVYYTLNGDIPDTNDYKYTDTIWLDSTTVLSARAFSTINALPSEVTDRTYIFNEDNFSLPVFSIITDSLNLWDWNTGIYISGPYAESSYPYYGSNFWNSWPRFSRLEYFNKNKIKEAEEWLDLEIHGGWSRGEAQKSFRFDFKSKYSGDLEVPLIPQKSFIESYNNINLRNGGQHVWSTKIQDGLISQVVSETNVDNMAYQSCLLYLNGKYWGVYGIREKMDKHYIINNYQIDSIDLIGSKGVYEGSDIDFIESYDLLIDTDVNSQSFYTLAHERFDLKNYIDYFIIQTYIQNKDWLGIAWGVNNVKLWRSKDQNGKWRYLLYDTDAAFGYFGQNENENYLHYVTNPETWSHHSALFKKMLTNDQFKCEFVNRYADLINTIFHPDTFSVIANKIKDEIYNAMPNHISRWEDYDQDEGPPFRNGHISPISSVLEWTHSIDDILYYNANRNSTARTHLNEELGLNGQFKVFLDVFPLSSGVINISTIQPKSYPWNGIYFDGCTIDLSAVPNSGYIFCNWTSNNIDETQICLDTINLYLSNHDTIIANFRECTVSNLSISLDTIENALSSLFDTGYGPYQDQWFLDDVQIEGINDSVFSPLHTGYYSVLVTDKDGCSSLSNPFLFDCNKLLETILLQDSITNSLYVNCIGGTKPYSYEWFIDSVYIGYLEDNSLDVYTNGTYYVIVEDINGCRSSTPTVISNELEVNIFPNPTTDLINLEFIMLYGQKYIISVFDIYMNIYHYIELPVKDHCIFYTHTFNLDINKAGVYLIKLESSNNQIIKRFIYLE